VNPTAHRVRCRNAATSVQPVRSIRQTVASERSADLWVEWHARFHDNDSRHLPSTENRFHELALAVSKHRDVIDEIYRCVVCTVVAAGTDVIFPAEIRVRYVGQVSSAVTAGGRIN